MITFALFSLAVVLALGATVYFSIGWKQAERRAKTAKTAETAYAELLTGSQRREANLLSELNEAKYLAHMAEENKGHFACQLHEAQNEAERAMREADSLAKLAQDATADAARLAGFVEQTVKDIEATCALLGFENPPTELARMREALRQHELVADPFPPPRVTVTS